MKETQSLSINELNKAWVDMFNNIDDVVEEIVDYYPDFESKIDRGLIKDAIRKTQKLAELIEKGRKMSRV
ncbi:hypothetical protein CMI47_18020 [Candidatus Pacearchaeota archaeon]|nr:hypothetical protein [Candidatus Pacearchaeota archaeon]|tara:strand:+ start:1980 stop:2189 length:210 start_codon:yes stop_codon:yes gene_type:complete